MRVDFNLKNASGIPIKGHFRKPSCAALRQAGRGNLNTKFLFLALGPNETSEILRWLASGIVGFKKIFILNNLQKK